MEDLVALDPGRRHARAMVLREIAIRQYRSVQELRLTLGKVTVVVGPNGCGKTNVYQALRLMARAAHGGIAPAVAADGGMASLLWAGPRKMRSKSEPMRVELEVRTDLLNYEIQLGLPIPEGSVFARDPRVKEEWIWTGGARRPSNTLVQRDANGAWARDEAGTAERLSGGLDPEESLLSQLRDAHRFPELWAMRNELLAWRFYHQFRTDPEAPVRHAQLGVRTWALAHDGADLAAAIQTIRESRCPHAPAFEEAFDAAFPGHALMVQWDAAQRGRIEVQSPDLARPLAAHELSDGTVRYVCLLGALFSPKPPPFLALNEPETSLHGDLLPRLAEMVRSASERSQIWLTTHSTELAERLRGEPGTVVVGLEKVRGATKVEGKTED